MSEHETSYDVVIHRAAQSELDAVPDPYCEEMKERLQQLGSYRQPTKAPYLKQMEDNPRLLVCRTDGYRAICVLDKPQFKVLLVDERDSVYNRLATAKARLPL